MANQAESNPSSLTETLFNEILYPTHDAATAFIYKGKVDLATPHVDVTQVQHDLYTSTATYKRGGSRRNTNIEYVWAVLFDDVGRELVEGRVKGHLLPFEPTFTIVTSKGNRQQIVCFKSPKRPDEVKPMLARLKYFADEMHLGDKKAFTLGRLMRMPWGVNVKRDRFEVYCEQFTPGSRLDPDEILELLNVPEIPKRPPRRGNVVPIRRDEGVQEILDRLPGFIGDGERNDTIYRLYIDLFNAGLTDEEADGVVNRLIDDDGRLDRAAGKEPYTKDAQRRSRDSARRFVGENPLVDTPEHEFGKYPFNVRIHPNHAREYFNMNFVLLYVNGRGIRSMVRNVENFVTLLRAYGVSIRYNVIKNEFMFEGMEHIYSKQTANMQTGALVEIQSLMENNKMSKNGIDAVRNLVTHLGDLPENQYNPVHEYLEKHKNAPDGSIEKLAACVELYDEDHRGLHDEVLRTWMIQGAAAGTFGKLSPRDDAIPKFELTYLQFGMQGKGKTTFFKDLFSGPEECFLESALLDPTNKDSVATATSYWGVELGEIDVTFGKTLISHLKGFLSRTKDVFRRPFAPADSRNDRGTTFGGTVNKLRFLRDTTGNRRFLPFRILRVLRDKMTQEVIDNAWGEAYRLYINGAAWWLDDETERRMAAHRRGSEELNPDIVQILQAFGSELDGPCRIRITAKEMLVLSGVIDDMDVPLRRGQAGDIDDYMQSVNVDKNGRPRDTNHGNVSRWPMPMPAEYPTIGDVQRMIGRTPALK